MSQFGILTEDSAWKIRFYQPKRKTFFFEFQGNWVEAEEEEEGSFVYSSLTPITPTEYRIYYPSGLLSYDPYAFSPVYTSVEMEGLLQNSDTCLYEIFGAHIKEVKGVLGVHFVLFAPGAKSVRLMGDFNGWDRETLPLYRLQNTGVFELFVPGVRSFETYKYVIETREGTLLEKSDPYAFFSEVRPKNASRVFPLNSPPKSSSYTPKKGPMLIYEVHLPSWKMEGNAYVNYRSLAKALADYCLKMHFTHVELLPILEHPLDGSWGYQVTGFFAPTSRLGTPEDFQYFVSYLQQRGIGVILDFVAAHFPKDPHALSLFDGTALYEVEGLEHPYWQTALFDYTKEWVRKFLISSALFWLEKMHVDGLRVDAVSSILYRDFGKSSKISSYREEGILFCQELTQAIHEKVPGALVIAEEETTFAGVTNPEGLGFDLKWNMGWVHDILAYTQIPFSERKEHYSMLTFSLMYAFHEHFLLPLSHDEVSQGKKSLFSKMQGDASKQYAQMRLLLSYQIGHPGGKLLFMGSEFGLKAEWDPNKELDWEELKEPKAKGLQKMVATLNQLYLKNPACWQEDASWKGFEWMICSDPEGSVISYLRKSDTQVLCFVHNFSEKGKEAYVLPLKALRSIREIFSSDDLSFGGRGDQNPSVFFDAAGGKVHLSAFGTHIFEVELG